MKMIIGKYVTGHLLQASNNYNKLPNNLMTSWAIFSRFFYDIILMVKGLEASDLFNLWYCYFEEALVTLCSIVILLLKELEICWLGYLGKWNFYVLWGFWECNRIERMNFLLNYKIRDARIFHHHQYNNQCKRREIKS